MRFAIVSIEGMSLAWWVRLQEEGHDVKVWIVEDRNTEIGDGIVEKAENLSELLSWASKAPDPVFFFDCTNKGDEAEALRKAGYLVVGGGKLADKLEKDRFFATDVATEAGMFVPDHMNFLTISEAIAFAQKQSDTRYVFKPNKYLGSDATYNSSSSEDMVRHLNYLKERYGDKQPNVMQEFIEGVAVSTAAWWNGATFLRPFLGTIEHKKLMNNDVGPATGCSLNLVWAYADSMPQIAERLQFDNLELAFRRAGLTAGLYDVNAVVQKKTGNPYFLEFTPRLGYDSELTSPRGLNRTMGELLYGVASATLPVAPFDTGQGWMGVRVSVPPYPFEHSPKEHSAKGTPILGNDGLYAGNFVGVGIARDKKGQLYVADHDGFVGVVTTTGTDIQAMNDSVLKYIKNDLQIPNLAYRTDAAEVIQEDLQAYRKAGYKLQKWQSI